jgi:hypothetical protein
VNEFRARNIQDCSGTGATYVAKHTIGWAFLKLGHPIWRRLSPKFYARIDRRIDMRLANTEADWKQHVPAFLNAVSSVQAFGRELARSTKDLHEEIVELRGMVQRQDDLLQQTLLALQGQVELLHEAVRGQGVCLQDAREVMNGAHDGLASSIVETSERNGRGA